MNINYFGFRWKCCLLQWSYITYNGKQKYNYHISILKKKLSIIFLHRWSSIRDKIEEFEIRNYIKIGAWRSFMGWNFVGLGWIMGNKKTMTNLCGFCGFLKEATWWRRINVQQLGFRGFQMFEEEWSNLKKKKNERIGWRRRRRRRRRRMKVVDMKKLLIENKYVLLWGTHFFKKKYKIDYMLWFSKNRSI